MYDYRETWKQKIADILRGLLNDAGNNDPFDSSRVTAEIPPLGRCAAVTVMLVALLPGEVCFTFTI